MSDYIRRERAALRQARELARQSKEQAKLDEYTRAQLEVKAHENQLQVLLSLYKEVGVTWDWHKIAASLPPPSFVDETRFEMRIRQQSLLLTDEAQEKLEGLLKTAKADDLKANQVRRQIYEAQLCTWGQQNFLAKRIIARDVNA